MKRRPRHNLTAVEDRRAVGNPFNPGSRSRPAPRHRFETETEQATRLMREMRKRHPGKK